MPIDSSCGSSQPVVSGRNYSECLRPVRIVPGSQRNADWRMVLAGLQDLDAAVTGLEDERSGQGPTFV
jgi:hypothetical protein